jgi:serine/threonine protein kinase
MTLDTNPPLDLLRALDFSSGQLLGSSNQGEVRRFQIDGHDLAIKAPKGRGLAWYGRRAGLRREYHAYQRVRGVPGFPTCHGFFDQRWLVLEYVVGTPFRESALADREQFFARLLEIIQAMHARGVAHGDLKRKDNLLVDPSGHPVVMDLGAATLRQSGWHPLHHRLFEFMRQTDLNAWIKLKYAGYEGVSARDSRYLKRSLLERALTRLRQ